MTEDKGKWTAENIPQELLDILDARAGKEHSRTGPVVAALVEILNAAGDAPDG